MSRIEIFCIVFFSFVISCNYKGEAVDATSIVGKWKGDSSTAQFDFLPDGRCVVNSVPADLVFFPPNEFRKKLFSGQGEWSFKKGSQFAQVFIRLNSISGIDKNGVSFTLYVAGRKGLLDNKPPWYLFMWEEEEGGNRIEFSRVN